MNFCGNRRGWYCCLFVIFGLLTAVQSTSAQSQRGFVTTAPATTSGEELTAQPDLWVLEVSFKKMRMISVEITNPKTGDKKRGFVWYLAYKFANRDLERKQSDADTAPVNEEDQPDRGPLFVPEFTLVTNDNGTKQLYQDSIIPEAAAVILRRERQPLKNSVAVVREIPKSVPAGTSPVESIYGMAMWRGIDPKTDHFTVFMGGFSNGYRTVKGPDGKPLLLKRTLVQEFWRPGDQFDQEEVEFRLKGEPKWIYRPDEPVTSKAN